jgi:NADH dehydrogenase
MTSSKKRILILGGGFGGVYTAMHLEKILKPEEASISLINQENYWVNQPMLPEVISGSIGITDVVSPIRLLCPRTDLVMRRVEKIDLKNKVVTVSPGFRPRLLEIPYDYLVIALGSITDFTGMPGMLEHALPFRTLAEALALRNHVIHALEEADVESDPALRAKLLTFVVAGGGFSGVEAVAELNDFVRRVKHNYIRLRDEQVRVVLVHSGDRILPEMDESLALFAQRLLTKRGVDLVLKNRLAAATSEKAILKSGAEIPCKTIVSTVPSSVAPVLQTLDCAKQKNRLLADGNLELVGYEGQVWALGDCAAIKTKSGNAVPPTAQHATREAKTVAMNIAAVIRGGNRSVFAFEGLGTMGSLGHYSAIANIFGLKVSGFLAWILWRMIYLMKVPGMNRKVRIALDWIVAMMFQPDLVQVRFFRSGGMMRQHFEPGEVIFNQGDIGDKVYVIQEGECEVLRGTGEEQVRLATLGKGDYFGEMAVLEDVSRNATVRARTAMDVVLIEKRDFNLLKAGVPAFGQVFQELARARSAATAKNPSGEKAQP